jgi:hypothetical protein
MPRFFWPVLFAAGVLMWYLATNQILTQAHDAERGWLYRAPVTVTK